MIEQRLETLLTNSVALALWLGLVALSLAALVYDLRKNNPGIGKLMKAVWFLTVLYSGPVGLAIYWSSGRRQIPQDTLWRRGFRSVAHCYSGCGAGEIVGVFIAAGVLSLGNWWVVGVTFALAYLTGLGMTYGPLVQQGVGHGQALKDAVFSESASIIVMEAVAIFVDQWLAADAKMNEVLFWSSLIFSLSMGLIAAYPVNLMLVHFGVKEGMASPKERAT